MKVEHVALYVEDLNRAKNFFEDYFNATAGELYHNPNTDFRSYFLSFDDGSRLEIMNRPNLVPVDRDHDHLGFAHLAFSVGSKDAVDDLTDRLKRDGFKVISGPRTTGDGYYESCILDLEGNQIEITV